VSQVEVGSRQKKSGLINFGGKFLKNKSKKAPNPALFSPGGPSAVRKSNFKPIGTAKINLKTSLKYDQFKLTNMPWDSIIQSVIATKVFVFGFKF